MVSKESVSRDVYVQLIHYTEVFEILVHYLSLI